MLDSIASKCKECFRYFLDLLCTVSSYRGQDMQLHLNQVRVYSTSIAHFTDISPNSTIHKIRFLLSLEDIYEVWVISHFVL